MVTKFDLSVLAPPPKLNVSQWCNEYRQLSREDSAEPGKFSTNRAPYQVEMMDAIASHEQTVFMTSAQVGKALSLDTPIPTPLGWSTMGDLKIGDLVFDENGNPCSVTFVTPIQYNRKCYKVVFSDGSEIIADADHQWLVHSDTAISFVKSEKKKANSKGKGIFEGVLTTEQIAQTYRYSRKDGTMRNRYSIPVQKPLNLPEISLPVHPYLLGLYLGDGSIGKSELTAHINDAVFYKDVLEQLNYRVEIVHGKNKTQSTVTLIINRKPKDFCRRGHDLIQYGGFNTYNYSICKKCQSQNAKHQPDPIVYKTLFDFLKELELRDIKYIPSVYLRASYQQRLELLQGLMDTDGSICSKSGRCEFVTTSEPLAKTFGELLSSLGIKYTVSIKEPFTTYLGEKVIGKTAYRFSFLVYAETPVFKLKRKLDRMLSDSDDRRKFLRRSETQYRRIVQIVPVESVPVKCISVDSPSHLYLAGEQMIPTHNTAILIGILGYYIHLDPCPILFVLPTIDFCKTFSKERLAPFIRDNRVVQEHIIEPRSRRSSSTLFTKLFKGGQLNLVGSNSVAGLSSRPVRLVLFDEIDRFETTSEGDALALAYKRTTTFWNRRIVLTSTPSIKGSSRIEKAFNESDQRHYYVPCPYCQNYQTLVWENIIYPLESPQQAKYSCSFCKKLIFNSSLSTMVRHGKWIAHNPSSAIAGFYLNELYSPWSSWGKVATEYEAVKDDPERYQVWVNTSLGLPYEAPSQSIDPNPLQERAENSPYACGIVPALVKFLTAGVDVQGDRFAVQILGFSKHHTHVIDYQEIPGDPLKADSWRILNDYLTSNFPRPDGSFVKIRATFIDSGYLTEEVYNASRKFSRLYACKGVAGDKPILQARSRPIDASYKGKPIPGGVRLHLVGTDATKTLIYNRLKLDESLPNSILFPNDLYPEYFDQLTNEHQVQRRKMGVNVMVWEKLDSHARVEVLDTFVYAIAAAYLLGLPRIKWDSFAQKKKEEGLITSSIERDELKSDLINIPEKSETPVAIQKPKNKKTYIKKYNNWLKL